MMISKHATYTAISGHYANLTISEREIASIPHCNDIPDLIALAYTYRLTHLWVMPGSGINPSKNDLARLQGYVLLPNWRHTYTTRERADTLISVWGREQKGNIRYPNVSIIFVEHCTWSFCEAYQDAPKKLLEVGLRLLYIKTGKHSAEWTRKPQTDLTVLPFKESARPLLWDRVPDPEELDDELYLHAYDKNSAYPRAAVEEHFGIGEPEHRDADFAPLAWDGKRPGIWRVTVHHPELILQMRAEGQFYVDYGLLPPVTWTWDKPVWLSTPMVKLVFSQGYHVTMHEAWIFPTYAHVFRKWVQDLWGIRQEEGLDAVDRQSFKQILNDTLGFTRSSKFEESPLARPDWSTQIVGGYYAAMIYNLIKIAQEAEMYPLFVTVDEVVYASSDANPETAVPGILEHSKSLGGYKHEWSLPVTDEIRAHLLSDMSRKAKLTALKRGIKNV
jgi:hypothetical protein